MKTSTLGSLILLTGLSLGAHAAAMPTGSDARVHLQAKDAAKVKRVKDALVACKNDAEVVRQGFESLGPNPNGGLLRQAVGGALVQFRDDLRELTNAVNALGGAPTAIDKLGPLINEVESLIGAIGALPAGAKIPSDTVAGFKRQERKARNKNAEVAAVLEPVVYR